MTDKKEEKKEKNFADILGLSPEKQKKIRVQSEKLDGLIKKAEAGEEITEDILDEVLGDAAEIFEGMSLGNMFDRFFKDTFASASTFNAGDAAKIRDEKLDKQLDPIYEKIKLAADEGKSTLTIDGKLSQDELMRLRALFTVEKDGDNFLVKW